MKITHINLCAEVPLVTSEPGVGPIGVINVALDAWQYDPIEAFCQTYPPEKILEHIDKDAIMKYAITHCSKLGKTLQGED